jgi:hypothetical protein
MLDPLERANLNHWVQLGPNTVGVSLPLSGGGSTSNFRNVVFLSYLEFRAMDKVQKPSNCVLYTTVITLYILTALIADVMRYFSINYFYMLIYLLSVMYPFRAKRLLYVPPALTY